MTSFDAPSSPPEAMLRSDSTASDSALYARARRLFGSWSAAVRSAGIDYESLQGATRARSLQTRRRNRRRRGRAEHDPRPRASSARGS